ncbi:hypothetical protein A6J60_011475 [Psychrobacter sp. FDAARGOS_221]|nr:hypothetical protein A6J60_011475 [Psychrobacter sp. FDAARGOS_221]
MQPTLHCPADIFLKPKNIKSMTTDKVIKMMSADKLTLHSAPTTQSAELTNPSQAKAAVLNNRSNKAAINNSIESESSKTKSVNAKTSNYPINLKTTTSSHSNTDAAANFSTPMSSNDSPLITNNSVFTDSASNSESKSLFNIDLTNIDFTAISFFISGILLMIYFFHLA